MDLNDIWSALPDDPGKPPLVIGVTMDLEVDLLTMAIKRVIVLLTERDLDLDGGDGFHGVAHWDIQALYRAVKQGLCVDSDSGYADRFVIRQRSLFAPGKFDSI